MKKITEKTKLSELIEINPNAGGILFAHGLHCIGCGFAAMETLEQGCLAHGMTKEQVKELVEKLNESQKKSKKLDNKKAKDKIKKLPKEKESISKLKEMIK
ncbi:MAG: DUF1858 domain-containing protein [Candidatus Pacearchaeota archaeon]|nr:DUF1858 domain-containing protein [Candidatus Pacearchaeota archaeon]